MCNIISLLNHWVRRGGWKVYYILKKNTEKKTTMVVGWCSFRKLQCYSKGMGFIFPNDNDEEKKIIKDFSVDIHKKKRDKKIKQK